MKTISLTILFMVVGLSVTVCGKINPITIDKPQDEPMKKKPTIAFYLQDGVEILDFGGPLEVFAYAGYKVFTVSKTKAPIKSQGILKVIPDYSIEDAPKADILAVFGGNGLATSKDKDVINWIKSQGDFDYYFSVCTGALILAASGILDGKTATTFHDQIDELRKYEKINVLENVRFIDNGKVISTAGVSAGIDGALHMVAKLDGVMAAQRAAYYMEYDKWTPGEGLILADDNPYTAPEISAEKLKKLEGTYELDDSSDAIILSGTDIYTMYAIIGQRKFPLFYASENAYYNLNNDKITFLWDNGKVVGYELKGKKYKKLSENVGDTRTLIRQ